MDFIIYDIAFLVIFVLGTFLFLYRNRSNLKREGIMYLYRTNIGVKIIDTVSKDFAWLLRPLQYVIVASGYILMGVVIYLITKLAVPYLTSPTLARDLRVPVLLPLVPYVDRLFPSGLIPPFYFTYWIIIIAAIAIPHEFAHGIFARFNKIKVKSTGFGFLGPFLAAFVEPDDKQMNKLKKFPQLTILAAGTFANVLFSIIFALLLWAFFALAFVPNGVQFNTYAATIVNVSSISAINGIAVNGLIDPSTINGLQNISLITVKSDGSTYYATYSLLDNSFKNNLSAMFVYEDSPALRSNLTGAIVEFEGIKVTSLDQLKSLINANKPGDNISIKSYSQTENAYHDYQITLAEKDGKPFLGIGNLVSSRSGFSKFIASILAQIRDPYVYYKSSLGNFGIFIYDLLWWLVLINLSVAIFNMVPVGLFDGGRFFYLTIWGITKSKKSADWAFKIITWIFLGVVAALMIKWALVFL